VNAALLLASGGLDSTRLRLIIHPVTPESVQVRPAPRVMMRLWGKGITAMTLPNGIYLDPALLGATSPTRSLLLVHELVHARQWREFGAFGFARRYLWDYLQGRFQGKRHRQAYLGIRFEVEARRLAALFE
jgi:hypothetical protein